jgi:predicted alpha-1,6-mannanase (GH76 family)
MVEAWRATGDTALLDTARRLADAGLSGLTRGGVLTESCDVGQLTCDDNQKQFKGVFSRYLADLTRVTGAPVYADFARRQADSIWSADRDALNRLGQRWAGGAGNQLDWRTQSSGLGALTAAAALAHDRRWPPAPRDPAYRPAPTATADRTSLSTTRPGATRTN